MPQTISYTLSSTSANGTVVSKRNPNLGYIEALADRQASIPGIQMQIIKKYVGSGYFPGCDLVRVFEGGKPATWQAAK